MVDVKVRWCPGSITWGLRKLRYDMRQKRKQVKEGIEVEPREKPEPIEYKKIEPVQIPKAEQPHIDIKKEEPLLIKKSNWREESQHGWKQLGIDIKWLLRKQSGEGKSVVFNYYDVAKIAIVTILVAVVVVGGLKLLTWLWSW